METSLSLHPVTEVEKERDTQFRERFRGFWMKSMAEGFGEELSQLQKEPDMTKPKLAMLIDALAGGTGIYLPENGAEGTSSGVSEVEMLLGVKR
ncbi:SubName: Full=Uncharacterized protein {ECO:0000313/EMBL:CCA66552.1} [Serendipita indica DSM 11827]|uniref:Ribosome assembly protein 3 n=1 Tax=Serendipita indica (strain DSM 11827) TaxID=1109443 RepID=G4T5F2_SERID|nr:SubName: Full=Uncharacterized protein {ECO:0000313/EMBL:CCA66552.1} [Serendipita indica DSM 11827]CCA66552.1 hypothetical protein PIIN_00236 [Serendipita indica DSM 11827]